MIDLNKMLNDVINDAKSIQIPVSDNIERKIYIDKKQYDRVGACYRHWFPQKYEIHLSEDAMRAPKKEIKNIIAHEVLHTCFCAMEHNVIWNSYKHLMNRRLGYNIQVKYSWKKLLGKY